MRVIVHRILLLGAMLIALSGCAISDDFNGMKAMDGYDRKVNINDIRQLRQIDRTPVEDLALIGFVNGIRSRLEQAHGKPCDCVVVVDSFGGYEAYSLSRQTIVVSAGVLAQASSEDEVAAIIAHELSHVYGGDTSAGWMQDAAVTLAKAASLTSGAGVYTLLLGDFVDDAAEGLVYHRWNANQETAADAFATRLILKAGYSLYGQKMAVRRLSTYGETAQRSKAGTNGSCMSTSRLNLSACAKALTGADESVYLDPKARLGAVMRAAWDAPAEQRRRSPSPKPPRFASVDYLFGLNELVVDDLRTLKRTLVRIERRPIPAELRGNVAVTNRLALAHAILGNDERASAYMTKSAQSTGRTTMTFNAMLKAADNTRNAEAVARIIKAMHLEIGLTEHFLPVEYYLSKRYDLTAYEVMAYGRCISNFVDNFKVYNRCAQFEDYAQNHSGAEW